MATTKKKPSRGQVIFLRVLCAMLTGFGTAIGMAAGRDFYTAVTRKNKRGQLIPIRGGKHSVI